MKRKEIKYYELNLSQEVVKLQCTYTLDKRVVNIMASATAKSLDFSILKQALNLAIERNDCTRLRFVKKNKQLMQYFIPEYEIKNVDCFEFNDKEEQEMFIETEVKKPIKYLKGEVIKPYFIKTFDNKYMVLFKVCHLIFDIYGLNLFINDIFDIYQSFLKITELPPAPKKFEDQLIKDIELKHNKQKVADDYNYFKNLFENNPEPYYAGFDGLTNKYTIKALKQNKRKVPLFFIKNSTKLYHHSMPKDICEKLVEFSKQHNITIANLLMYIFSTTQSRLNNDIPYLLPLELCNVRGTLLERKCAGTKAQSLNCYTKVDKEKTFLENVKEFSDMQTENYRHIGIKDFDAQKLLHTTYKSSMMSTYYSLSFSFIPFEKRKDFELNLYSNGKCALPAYVAVLYDYKNNEMGIGYDCQTALISEKNVKDFHKNLILCIEQVTNNPNILIKDIKLQEMK